MQFFIQKHKLVKLVKSCTVVLMALHNNDTRKILGLPKKLEYT